MDTPFRSPLVDCFRRGEAPRDVRLEAARGLLAPRALEQLVLLVLLVADADAEVAAAAEVTLSALPPPALAAFLASSDTDPDVREFFEKRGITSAGAASDGVDTSIGDATLGDATPDDPATGDEAPTADAVVGTGDAPPEDAGVGAVDGRSVPPPDAAAAEAAEEPARLGVAQRLSSLTVAERMKAAMQGTREERTILIRDPNRLVSSAVLSSPKLTESEVEAIAKMGNVSEEVLRTVGMNRNWTKSYLVIAALARNSKTPIAVSLSLLNRLTERDTKMLSMDRNVPEPVRLTARRLLTKGAERRK